MNGGARPATGRLAEWLQEQALLRGPFLYADYWATVLGLRGVVREEQARAGRYNAPLFRLGIDRPDLDLPSYRAYLLLFFLAPILIPFRSLRRLGRYRVRHRATADDTVARGLESAKLDIAPARAGRVRVSHDGETLADDVLDPHLVVGFASLFWATYKLPLASLIAIVPVAVLTPVLAAAGLLSYTTEYWVTIGYPLLVLVIFAILREWAPAFIGALPILIGRYLMAIFHPTVTQEWGKFVWALVALFGLYVLADWLFTPRPVPPTLLLYTKSGAGQSYERSEDAPYWLEGEAYWVWRSLILSPAEINKFWEKDWERVELWIRADGPDAGVLEWVVTDLHYRELWMPLEKLGAPKEVEKDRAAARAAAAAGRPGLWLIEVDADLVFHYPFLRTVAYLKDDEDHPVQTISRITSALWKRAKEPQVTQYHTELELLRIASGHHVLSDIPELLAPRATRHLLDQPWRYWRYPLGAARRRYPLLYDLPLAEDTPPLADPKLQVKARS